MAHLVEVTKYSRLTLKIGGFLAGLILTFYILFQGGVLINSIINPPKPDIPKEEFGKLPHIKFPSFGNPGISYSIQTIDEKLPPLIKPPKLGDRVNVYKLKEPSPGLLDFDDAKKKVGAEKFKNNQTKLSPTLYEWTHTVTGAIIKYDIVTKNFSITSNYLTNPFLYSDKLMPDENRIKDYIKAFLNSIEANTKNLDMENVKIEKFELNGSQLLPIQNLANAKFARINIMQNPIDNIPIIYDDPNRSNISFMVSYPSSFQVVEGQFYNLEVDDDKFSDYPIKTADEALKDLEAGNAYMINPKNLTQVAITNVELKYYLNKDSSEYLLPIVVFTGIDFTGYVEAIKSTSLSD